MRNFIMDVWVWTKDEDVEVYMRNGIDITFNNVHEYIK